MPKLLAALCLTLGLLASASAFADGALICRPESSGACKGRQYCCYAGGESAGDKYCKSLGCVRGGTSSCPNAANVSSCGTRDKSSTEINIPWCAPDQPAL